MDEQQQAFERMQEALLRFVDTVNASHEQGVDFGIGKPLFPAEIHTVAAIAEREGINVTGLAALLGVSKPTISERIKVLAAKGVIEKRPDPDDAKAVTLWLTGQGRVAVGNHDALHQAMYAAFCKRFGPNAATVIQQFHETFLLAAELESTVDE